MPTNDLPYEVGTLPELTETGAEQQVQRSAQPIKLPQVINGRIDKPGDFDTYRFEGKAGQQLIAEVTGRRLQSPIDSLIRLTDDTGETLAWNDDRMDKDGHLHLGTGLLTHHADSYLHATLPSDGPWFVTDQRRPEPRRPGLRLPPAPLRSPGPTSNSRSPPRPSTSTPAATPRSKSTSSARTASRARSNSPLADARHGLQALRRHASPPAATASDSP